MRISHVLARKGSQVVSVWRTRAIKDVIALFDERNIASVMVTEPGDTAPLGIASDRSIIHALARGGNAALDEPISTATRSPVPTCQPDERVSDVLRRMTDDRVRHMLVMDGSRVAGIVSIGDLVKIRLEDAEIEGRVLRERALGQIVAET